jgi:acetyl esterase/lipase
LVLMHGLGETHQAVQALRAWPDLYGASDADARLSCPPFVPPGKKMHYWSEDLLARFNADFTRRPYEGAVLVCPRTPNPSLVGDREKLFDAYSAWLCDAVLPAVERRLPGATKHVGLDGCSLGGYVAVEALVRRPQVFSSGGCIQGALAQHRLTRYATQLAAVHQVNPAFRFRIATSLQDPYLDVGKAFATRLTEVGVPHELDIVPGPHNQPWLCEIGTPRLLRWHDLVLPGRSDQLQSAASVK